MEIPMLYKMIAIFFGLFLHGCLSPMNQDQMNAAKYNDPYTVVLLLSHKEKSLIAVAEMPKELNYAVAEYLCRDVLDERHGFIISQVSAREYLRMDQKSKKALIEVFKELKKCDDAGNDKDLELDWNRVNYVKGLPRPLQVSIYNNLSESKKEYDISKYPYKQLYYRIIVDKPIDFKYCAAMALAALTASAGGFVVGIIPGALICGLACLCGVNLEVIKPATAFFPLGFAVIAAPFSLFISYRHCRSTRGSDGACFYYIPNSYESGDVHVKNLD